jgi:glycosyltransferase involved in cell wall biosynthesis
MKLNYHNWECIIINDGGTDNTDDVVGEYIQQDKRFSYHYRPASYGKGLPGCRNFGLDIASGEFVVFFDDDDVVHPELLTISLGGINSGDFDFCHYQKQSFNESKPTIEIYDRFIFKYFIDFLKLHELITYKIAIASCTVIWKKSFLNERFNESLQYAEEWEFYNRLFIKNKLFKGIAVNNILYYNRKHPISNTADFYNGNKLRIESHSNAAASLLSTYNNFIPSKNFQTINYLLNILIKNRSKKLYQECVIKTYSSLFTRIRYLLFYFIFPVYYPMYSYIKNDK